MWIPLDGFYELTIICPLNNSQCNNTLTKALATPVLYLPNMIYKVYHVTCLILNSVLIFHHRAWFGGRSFRITLYDVW